MMFSISLTWQPQLPLFRGALLIAAIAAWLIIIYSRLAVNHPGRRRLILFAPKAVVAILLLLLFFDPVWTGTRKTRETLRFLALTDNSSSMEVVDKNGKSRYARARHIANTLEQRVTQLSLDRFFFTDHTADHPGKQQPDAGSAPRPTCLAQALLDIETLQAAGKYDGAIILTDGGDERFEPFQTPSIPLHFIKTGTGPGLHNDIEINAVEAPDSVEPDTDFNIIATLRGYGDNAFMQNLGNLRLELEEYTGDAEQWMRVSGKTVDLRSGWAEAIISVHANAREGERRFRLLAPQLEGELTHLNNKRHLSVNIQEQRLRVLLYTRMLGRNEAVLRHVLSEDPGIELTSLIRLQAERFILKGEDEQKEPGIPEIFPDSAERLQKFNTVIIGSFPSDGWTDKQMQALVEFVERGGSAVFLGGADSFGRGGYAETRLSALFPWVLRHDEPEPVISHLAVAVAPAVAVQDIISGWSEKLNAAHPLYIHSINRPGRLRAGAASLLNVLHDGENIPVIAIQTYGRGRTMGIATDTIWRWRTDGGKTRAAYDRFWSGGIRYIAGLEQGGRLMRIEFDRKIYHPGERAEIQVRIAGDHPDTRITIQAEKLFNDTHQNLAVDLQPGAGHAFRSRTIFRKSGNYTFKFTAFADNQPIETYTRTMHVGAQLNEGANIYLDRGFLNDLAARSGGEAIGEDNLAPLVAMIRKQLVARDRDQAESVVQYRGIYLILIILILAGEWIIRRRMELF